MGIAIARPGSHLPPWHGIDIDGHIKRTRGVRLQHVGIGARGNAANVNLVGVVEL